MTATAAPETITATYRLPEENQPELERRLAKINRAARKIGVAEVTYRVLSTTVEKIRKPDCTGFLEDTGRVRRVHTIEVTGERPQISGWTFIAALRHFGEDGTIVAGLPGYEIPERYRNAGSDCDHCGHRRQRNDTYLLQNEAGEIKQVGSTCLVDFLGHPDPHTVARMCEWLREIEVACGDEESWGMRGGDNLFDLRWYLGWVALATRCYGWVSRKRARELSDERGYSVSSTSQSAWFLEGLTSRGGGMSESERRKELDKFVRQFGFQPVPSEEDRALAEDAVEWALALEEREASLNEYEHNLLVVARMGITNWKVMGLAASLIAAYKKAMDLIEERTRTARPVSQHVGTVGKREVFTVTVRKVIPLSSDFGPSIGLHIMETPEGNRLKWFATSAKDLEEGKTYVVKATVKEHGEYKGNLETVVNRVAVVREVEEEPAAPAAETETPAPVEAPQPATQETEATEPMKRSSTVESPVKRVREIAAEMYAANPQVSRKEVIARCVSEGISPATAATQYGHWKRALPAAAETPGEGNAPAAPEDVVGKIKLSGPQRAALLAVAAGRGPFPGKPRTLGILKENGLVEYDGVPQEGVVRGWYLTEQGAEWVRRWQATRPPLDEGGEEETTGQEEDGPVVEIDGSALIQVPAGRRRKKMPEEPPTRRRIA
jgi:uncharacterized protein (DUF2147 family)